jgi:hypothetical protein
MILQRETRALQPFVFAQGRLSSVQGLSQPTTKQKPASKFVNSSIEAHMSDPKQNDPQISTFNSEERGSRRGPELMKSEKQKEEEKQEKKQEDVREKTLDKTLADSFPTSDPPSSIPDPSEDEFDEKQAS